MTRRTLRVASLIRNIVADGIQAHLSDPRIEPLTSITRVEVTADLSLARVYVSVMASEARRTLCLRAIESAAGRLRAMVARQVALRKAPRLEFFLDESVRGSFEIVQLIERVMEEPHGDRPLSSAPDANLSSGSGVKAEQGELSSSDDETTDSRGTESVASEGSATKDESGGEAVLPAPAAGRTRAGDNRGDRETGQEDT